MSTEGPLEGKVALVTGGSRGLGRAICFGLAAAGATVVVSSRKEEVCRVTADEVAAETGRPTDVLPLHVGRWEALEPAVDAVVARHGRIDVLVNNAAVAPSAPSLLETSEALYDKVMEIDLKGPFRLMAVAGARMREAGGGSIINISSVGAQRPSATEAVYAAAKAGLNALTMAFAQEYAPHVRVNAIMPGAFATDMAQGWDDAFVGKVVDRLPAGRIGNPSEIAGAVVYLAGDHASYTTGVVLPVDGGRLTVY
jgi:NAD(P)-dependent dehydrogenase (short-subunit alcohol dehydrogenase family)